MKIAYFTHSIRSDWNHGNAHFVRGVLTELQHLGHQVVVFEPRNNWSANNLVSDCGADALRAYLEVYPGLVPVLYDLGAFEPSEALEEFDLVLVHEWNEPELVAKVGAARRQGGFRLLFHDTHHRAVSAPAEMQRYDLRHYDGVLAFGNVIRDLYLERGWASRAWTWHEAADTKVFFPQAVASGEPGDLVWIGNWGDGERTRELQEFLLGPVDGLRRKATLHGVRYPPEALVHLEELGIRYGGYLPNYRAPGVFAAHRVTVHVPRRPYVEALPGIPTIRPFEALACGIPLVSAPWSDSEGLFRPGVDYLTVSSGEEMKQALQEVLQNEELRQSLIAHGLETIRQKHTCAHRSQELLQVAFELGLPGSRIS